MNCCLFRRRISFVSLLKVEIELMRLPRPAKPLRRAVSLSTRHDDALSGLINWIRRSSCYLRCYRLCKASIVRPIDRRPIERHQPTEAAERVERAIEGYQWNLG